MYTTDHKFPVIPIKNLVDHDSEPTMTHKLATGKKTSVSNLRVLFCLCGVQKVTSHVDTKELNTCNQSQKFLRGISVGIPQH